MANYDLDTQTVRDNILASDLSPSLKNAISSLLGDALNVTIDNYTADPETEVSISETVGFASAQAGGKYTASSNTGIIIIEGDAPTEINVNVETSSSQVVIVGGGGSDTITLRDNTIRASADGTVGGANVSGGAGDDVLTGTFGNDILDGGAGDDTLNGGAGDDRIFTGTGSDKVDGGAGYDQVIVSGDRSGYTLVVNGDRLEITQGSETKTITGAEFISFDQGGPIVVAVDEDQATLARLYEAILDRPADGDGFGNWLNALAGGMSLSDIAKGFAASDEFTTLTASQDDAAFVEGMYQRTFDRAADPDGATLWQEQLASGAMDRGTVALNFAASEEARAKFDYIVGNYGDDIVTGGDGDDILNAGKGNDRIVTGTGSDTVDGGPGYDQVVIPGDRANYTVVVTGDRLEIASGSEVKSITGAEFISFDQGGPIVVANDESQATVARLYESVLDRPADGDGLGHWLNALANGTSLSDIAKAFAASDEFTALTANQDDAAFVEGMYQRTFDRPADPDGAALWQEQLASGAMDRGTVALNFAASDEAQAKFDYVTIIGITGQDENIIG